MQQASHRHTLSMLVRASGPPQSTHVGNRPPVIASHPAEHRYLGAEPTAATAPAAPGATGGDPTSPGTDSGPLRRGPTTSASACDEAAPLLRDLFLSGRLRVAENPAEAGFSRADDGIRTRDLHLGKVAL